jgi:hypothetical protein
MADPQDPKTITFGQELDPSEEARYRERISKARSGGGVNALKDATPLGGVERPSIPLMTQHGKSVTPSPLTEDGGVQARPPGSPLLRPETAKQIQDLASAQVAAAAGQKAEEKKVEEKKVEEDVFEMFDFAQRNEAERILNNKTRRAAIEARCEPMNLADLIIRDEVRQVVPIVPKSFEVVFRSMTPDENLFIRRYLSKKDPGQNDQYLIEKFGLLQLACCLVSINGKDLPPHQDVRGDIDEDAFEVKLKMLTRKSGYVVADLGINYYWFDIRVRKLLNPDSLGNG